MNDWKDHWHSEVHNHFGEVLFYYLVKVNTVDYELIVNKFNHLLSSNQWGSIRVFPIFGRHDLIIRAWISPVLENRFRKSIKEIFENHDPLPFAVTDILLNSVNDGVKVVEKQLRKITPELIFSVQEGRNPEAKQNLVQDGLIIENKQSADLLMFYISVQIPSQHHNITERLGLQIKEYLAEYCKPNGFIEYSSLYKGFGFCDLLINCQVKPSDYFNISTIPNWISTELKNLDVTTETFLAHKSEHLVGNERIEKGTFIAFRGLDPFIANILPEAYFPEYADGERCKQIKVSLQKNKKYIELLTDEDREMIYRLSSSFLKEEDVNFSGILFSFFSRFEQDMRKNLMHYLNKNKINADDYIIKDDKSKKYISMDELIIIFNKLFKKYDKPELIVKNHQVIARIRNQNAHGTLVIEDEIENIINELCEKIPVFNRILIEIRNVVNS